MKEINVIKTGVKAVVIDHENGSYTIKTGSIIRPAQTSLRTNLLALRQVSVNPVTDTEVIKDITLTSLSAIASILSGSMTNGNKYFGLTSTPRAPKATATSAPTSAPVSTPTPTPTTSEETSDTAQTTPDTPKSEPTSDTAPTDTKVSVSKKDRQKLVKDIDNLCEQWGFTCDPRMKDNLLYLANLDERKGYLHNCAELEGFDDSLLEVCENLLNNAEFSSISDSLDLIKGDIRNKKINKRLSIYFGNAGTGKTSKARNENPNAIFEVARENDKPSELFTTFNPTTNKYEKTPLALCAESGGTYILDEGNLLPRACWSRLQSMLDNTTSFIDRGIEIKIADSFKFITTMNLETNFGKRPLPNPIVSRACEIRKFDKKLVDETAYIW